MDFCPTVKIWGGHVPPPPCPHGRYAYRVTLLFVGTDYGKIQLKGLHLLHHYTIVRVMASVGFFGQTNCGKLIIQKSVVT
jgi:hypothetical protein